MAILMDLSKAFATTRHDPPTTTLYAYYFNKDTLKLLHSCLSNGWHENNNKQTV